MEIVTLPRLGQTMESGVVGKWHVGVGGSFSEGDALYEVETDKITTDVEARMDGVLLRVLVGDGDEIPIGAPIAVIAAAGEAVTDDEVSRFLVASGAAAPADPASVAPVDVEPVAVPVPVAPPEPARAEAVEQVNTAGGILAVPKARDLARRRGLDLASVSGSGEGGVIRVVDVLAAHAAPTEVSAVPVAAAPSTVVKPGIGGAQVKARIPLRGIRKAMAESLAQSWPTVPQFTQQVTVDASALRARRERLKFEGVMATYNDLLVSAVAQVAREHPDVNASLQGDEVVQFDGVNVSIAVATDEGLVVPVIHGAHQLSIGQIAERAQELAERGRSRKLTAQDMADGTITVSNLGSVGIESGTAIVNPPQVAIVFVGAMQEVPIVREGRITLGWQLGLSVSFDHRVVDGMTAARFTAALKQRLENGG